MIVMPVFHLDDIKIISSKISSTIFPNKNILIFQEHILLFCNFFINPAHLSGDIVKNQNPYSVKSFTETIYLPFVHYEDYNVNHLLPLTYICKCFYFPLRFHTQLPPVSFVFHLPTHETLQINPTIQMSNCHLFFKRFPIIFLFFDSYISTRSKDIILLCNLFKSATLQNPFTSSSVPFWKIQKYLPVLNIFL